MSCLSARLGRVVVVALLASSAASTAGAPAASAASPRERADRALVVAAAHLDGCLARAGSCVAQQRALDTAGRRLDAAVGHRGLVARSARLRRGAPVVSAAGARLAWSSAGTSGGYILVSRSVRPRSPRHYTVVRGTTATIAGRRGRAFVYRVRTIAIGSAWSVSRRVRFPAPPRGTASAPAHGTSTPTPVTPTTATSPVTPVTAGAPGAPRIGIVVGSAIAWQLQFAQKLGAHSARMEFPIGTAVSDMAPIIDAYARAGIQANLLAGFAGRIPSAADVANLGRWAAAFGPGGTFWQGKGYAPSLAVDRIEFGNESSGPWQYASLAGVADWPHAPQYAAIAQGYALAFKDAAVALRAANSGVRLLAVADVAGRELTWMDNMFRAVPDLGSYVGGWVVHPYGPDWARNVDDAMAQARAHGASDAIPLYVTEIGVSTDDGGCLNNNYGWSTCMTYAQAASTMTTTVAAVVARYASRLKEVDLYSAGDLRDHAATTDSECYFGALTATAGTKGAYTGAVERLLAQTG